MAGRGAKCIEEGNAEKSPGEKPGVERLFSEGLLWTGGGSSGVAETGAESGLRIGASTWVEPEKVFAVSFLPSVDALLPTKGLCCNAVHEFLSSDSFALKSKGRWHPALLVAGGLIRNFLLQKSSGGEAPGRGVYFSENLTSGSAALLNTGLAVPDATIAWVGRQCFPTPHFLQILFNGIWGIEEWRKRNFFLDSQEKKKRIWCLSQLLQSPSPLVVVADGARFSLLETRILQHACEKGKKSGKAVFFLLLRPAWEQERISAAETRWHISPQEVSQVAKKKNDFFDRMFFSLELLRSKGRHAVSGSEQSSLEESSFQIRRNWVFEVEYGKNTFALSEISPVSAFSRGENSEADSSGQSALPLLAASRV